jgi:hypothetical protein
MSDHYMLLQHCSAYLCIHDAVHTVIVEEEGDVAVWVMYDNVSANDCEAICLSHYDLVTLLDKSDNNEDMLASLFGPHHLLTDLHLQCEMNQVIVTSSGCHRAVTCFYNRSTGMHYICMLPLLNCEEYEQGGER